VIDRHFIHLNAENLYGANLFKLIKHILLFC